MNYPDKATYRRLYARYLSENGRSVNELLDLAGPSLKGRKVVDLCGGAGELSIEAARRGAEEVVMVDNCPEMADWAELKRHGVFVFSDSVESVLESVTESVDVIFCRQAVNYWFDEYAAQDVANFLNHGGLFIFNTFNVKPEDMLAKNYEFQGLQFIEISVMGYDEMVYHVQCREGMPPHVTSFKWIRPGQFEEWLSPYFRVDAMFDGKTTLYKCTKR